MNSNIPAISVIIPTYKPANYLYECLDSISKQTLNFEYFEVLIILNGCNEPYASKINEYVKKSKLLIRFFQTDKGGVSNARNIGIENAKGQYLTFIDDDDYISDTFLESLLNKSNIEDITASNSIAFFDESKRTDQNYYLTAEYEKCSCLIKPSLFKCRRFYNGPWGKLIPRIIIEEIRFDSQFTNGEDELFLFEISKNVKGTLFSGRDAIYFRRIRGDSAISNNKSKKFLLVNGLKLISALTNRYFRSPFKYNIAFYLSRIIAELKCIIIYLK